MNAPPPLPLPFPVPSANLLPGLSRQSVLCALTSCVGLMPAPTYSVVNTTIFPQEVELSMVLAAMVLGVVSAAYASGRETIQLCSCAGKRCVWLCVCVCGCGCGCG